MHNRVTICKLYEVWLLNNRTYVIKNFIRHKLDKVETLSPLMYTPWRFLHGTIRIFHCGKKEVHSARKLEVYYAKKLEVHSAKKLEV